MRIGAQQEYHITRCPACGANDFRVTRLECRVCGTALEGCFSGTKLAHLSEEQLRFVEAFVKNRGNLKEMERELGVSYPTVRGRLDRIVRNLGFEPDEPPADRSAVLEMLERNEIDSREAIEALRDLKGAR